MTDFQNIADSQQDRAGLNVGGTLSKGKRFLIGIGILIAVLVGVAALLMAYFNFTEPEAEIVVSPDDSHYTAGLEQTALDGEKMFAALTLEAEQKKQAEASRLAKAEAARKKAEEEANAKRHIVTRTTDTPPQPRPVVTRSGSNGNSSGNKNAPPTPEQRKLSGSVMVNYAGEKAAGAPKREYDNRFNASSFADGSVALRKAGALDFLLIHGTAIPCALYTQIISDYEGFVTCRVTQDIYSANGAALLVERGSMVSGTQKVAMELGKARIFTNWADIETPKGVSIRIDSLGTGALGASGHEAWVDNHFAERFGGAIMLSFVDDALGALSQQASKDSEVQFDNSTKNASDMASKALDASINIAPTGYSYIGQRINILIARDIDMSSVYQFEESVNE
ncbi:MAG: type IV secretion system protein VirB10 [Saezia sp.]